MFVWSMQCSRVFSESRVHGPMLGYSDCHVRSLSDLYHGNSKAVWPRQKYGQKLLSSNMPSISPLFSSPFSSFLPSFPKVFHELLSIFVLTRDMVRTQEN